MWLITPFGFYSVVAKSGDKHDGLLTIRSRVKSDLEALKEFVPSLGPIAESDETDYRYRAKAKAEDISIGFGSMIENIDYSNFKDKVAEAQGDFRASLYGEVWNRLYELQENEAAAS
jgi:hypothetical protein